MNARGRANVLFAETENREHRERKNHPIPCFCATPDIRTKPGIRATTGGNGRKKTNREWLVFWNLVVRGRLNSNLLSGHMGNTAGL